MRIKKHLSLLFIWMITTAVVSATGRSTDPDELNKNNNVSQPSLAVNTFDYKTALGVRGLGTSGLTIKHFTTDRNAIEGIIGFGPGAFSVTALWEHHALAFDEPGLNWYYGVGGHLATQTDWVYYEGLRGYRRREGDFGIGIDGIFGIEYKIKEVPIAVSVDLKPFLEVTTRGDAYLAIDPGLGVKFTF